MAIYILYRKFTSEHQSEDEFISDTKFQDVIALYVFDKKLRLLVLDAIERLEVAFRVDIAYLLGARSPFAYNDPTLLHGNFTTKLNAEGKTRYEIWLGKHNNLINRSKEDFVKHYRKNYGLPLPIWVAIELWDFGLLSTFYQGMKVPDKTEIAAKYSIADWRLMESWLRCLNYVRNVVAHHSRLWNRNLIDQPKLPKKNMMPAFDPIIGQPHVISKIYAVLCILAYFMHKICPRSSWTYRLQTHIKSFPDIKHLGIKNMGFPEHWEQHDFWQN